MRFWRQRRAAVFLAAAGPGASRPVQLECELRRDPLTGRTGRVAHFQGFQLTPPDLTRAVAHSRRGCPFCGPRLMEVTPCLSQPRVPGGRLHQGEAWLFPNISPYDRHSVVVSLTKRHYVPLGAFTQAQLVDGLAIVRRYFELLPVSAPGTHALLLWNYMPPAGATQVHPHFQAFATDRPGWLLEEEVRCSRAYLRRHHTSYWEDLLESERREDRRLVAEGRETAWLTAFVSRGVLSDLLCLFPGHARIGEVASAAWEEFTRGLRGALRQFQREGIRSFNLALYEAPRVQLGGTSGCTPASHHGSTSMPPSRDPTPRHGSTCWMRGSWSAALRSWPPRCEDRSAPR